MEKKYELTNETISLDNKILYRIKALKDFGYVKKEDLGGFIEKEENLSHKGDCWVYDQACIYKEARVSGDAQIYGNAQIYDNAAIWDYATVGTSAQIYGNAAVYGNAEIGGDAEISGNARIYDNALVFDQARIFGKVSINEDAQVFGNAEIGGYAEISGNARIYGNAVIKESQCITTGSCVVDLSKNLKENIRCQTNLFPQKDYVIAYKQVNKDLTSFFDSSFQYKIGEWVEAENPNMSTRLGCAKGLHFSNVNYWDNCNTESDTTYLMAKIMLNDIIAVQYGKIRCKRAFIIDRYDIEDN